MKKRIIFSIVVTAFFMLQGSSPWEGAAAVAPPGELPSDGFYVATNSFPRNTVVDITNIETNRSIRVIVSNTINSPGLLAVVSREAAELIGMRPGSVSRIRMVQPSDPIAYLRFTESMAAGIPEYDSGEIIDEETLLAEVYEEDTYIPPEPEIEIAEERPAPPAVPGYVVDEPEWGGNGRLLIVDLPGYDVIPVEPFTEQAAVAVLPEPEPEPVYEEIQEPVYEEPWYYITEAEFEPEEVTEIVQEPVVEDRPVIVEQRPVVEQRPPEPEPVYIASEDLKREVVKDVSPKYDERPPVDVVKDVPEFQSERFQDEFEKDAPVYITEVPRDEVVKETSPFLTEVPRDEVIKETSPWEEYVEVAEAPVQRPVERPVEQPVQREEPRPAPVEQPVEQPREEPVQQPVEQPQQVLVPVEALPNPPEQTVYGINPADIIPGIVVATPERQTTPAPSHISPVPSNFSVRTINQLDRGQYYVQIAALSADKVENAVRQIDRSYDPVVFTSTDNMYRILIGPLNQGESAAILARFKSIGYSDAFVRRGG